MQKTKGNPDLIKQINKLEADILSLKINYTKSRMQESRKTKNKTLFGSVSGSDISEKHINASLYRGLDAE